MLITMINMTASVNKHAAIILNVRELGAICKVLEV